MKCKSTIAGYWGIWAMIWKYRIEEMDANKTETKLFFDLQAEIFISSLTDAGRFAYAVRKHWAIENQLHWCLNVIFEEDAACARKDFFPAQFECHSQNCACFMQEYWFRQTRQSSETPLPRLYESSIVPWYSFGSFINAVALGAKESCCEKRRNCVHYIKVIKDGL